MRSTRWWRNSAMPQAISARSTGARAASRCGMRPSAATCSTVRPQAQLAPCGRKATRRGSAARPPSSSPARARSRVDLPAPLGPHQRHQLAGPGGEVDVVQHGPQAEPDRQATYRDADRRARLWRATSRRHLAGDRDKKGCTDQRGQHAEPGLLRRSAAPGRRCGSAGRRPAAARRRPGCWRPAGRPGRSPSSGRSRCGTTSPTKPIPPATAAPPPTASAVPSAIRRMVRATGTPRRGRRRLAQAERIQPAPDPQQHAACRAGSAAPPGPDGSGCDPPARPSARR